VTVHEDLGLEEGPWTTLCDRIRDGACVPVVGGQLREGLLPLPEAIAQMWATELGYPLARRTELAMVAEFAAQYATDEAALLDRFKRFANAQLCAMDDSVLADGHPYRLLAELPLDLYITTTYDDLIERSLRRFRSNCTPVSVSCRWNPDDRWWEAADDIADLTDLDPSKDRPVVFHLHGRLADPPSMVLTEQDHIEFTTKLVADSDQNAQKEPLLPANIKRALARNAWLFVGYGAADRNLRGLLQALATQIGTRDKHAVAVQLQHDVAVEGMEEAADEFLTGYFRRLLLGRKVDVVLTDARTFLGAIRDAVHEASP
jgi:hypothetical protein